LKIGVIGLGYVGLSYALVFAYKGYSVVGVDVDEYKVNMLKNKKPVFYEKGVEDLLNETIDKTLIVSTDYKLLEDADLIFICVNAPTLENGLQDTTQLENALRNLAEIVKSRSKKRVIVIKSTVLPGTTRRLAKYFQELTGLKIPGEIDFAYNPEFLREGMAIHDVLYPSRVVIAGYSDQAVETLRQFYRELYDRVGYNPPIIELTLEEAELVKYASNSFLALRVSYSNMIADLCETIPYCNVHKVLEAVGLDPRIGREYLKPGIGFGGSCLPKDLKALIKFYEVNGLEPLIFRDVLEVNERRIDKIIGIIKRYFDKTSGLRIVVLGLAFKPGTDDIRDSQSMKLVYKLIDLGVKVYVHDPMAMDNARRQLGDRVEYVKDLKDIIPFADVAVISTGWSMYRDIVKYIEEKAVEKPKLIIDTAGFITNEDIKRLREKGCEVFVVGISR